LTEKSGFDLNESLERIVLHSEKKMSDRTNIIIAANSFLFMPFATLLTSELITGYLQAIPIILCTVGIGLNVFLGSFNKIQTARIRKDLKNLRVPTGASPFFGNYFRSADSFYDFFNKYAPILMIIAWSLCLVFFVLQITIGIV
jgi:hypothetical protein